MTEPNQPPGETNEITPQEPLGDTLAAIALSLGIVAAVLIAPMVFINAYLSSSNERTFLSDGKRVTAKVLRKKKVEDFLQKVPTKYYATLSYWTGSVTDGGELVIVRDHYIESPIVSGQLKKGDKVTVYYLPNDREKVLLALSTDESLKAPIQRFSFGWWLLGGGGLAVVLSGLWLQFGRRKRTGEDAV